MTPGHRDEQQGVAMAVKSAGAGRASGPGRERAEKAASTRADRVARSKDARAWAPLESHAQFAPDGSRIRLVCCWGRPRAGWGSRIRPRSLTSDDRGSPAIEHDRPRVTTHTARSIFRQMLGLILLRGRTSSIKDVELLGLRHEVAVLHRTHPGPRLGLAGPTVLAAVTRRRRSCAAITSLLRAPKRARHQSTRWPHSPSSPTTVRPLRTRSARRPHT